MVRAALQHERPQVGDVLELPRWDNIANDPIAQAAGFDSGTVFPGLDPSISGATYLEVLSLPTRGDVTIQMSFKHIAAKLNFALLPIPDISPLLADVEDYFTNVAAVGSARRCRS